MLYAAIFIFLLLGAWWYLRGRPHGSLSGKRVFITGCDSGFGELMALAYCKQGAHVYAGVLNDRNGQSLESRASGTGTITAVVLDVTRPKHFQEAFHRLESTLKTTPLDALICNAGIYNGWLVEFTTEEEYRHVMDVNFMGCLRTIQTFLPLLHQSKGRIIGITSVAALLAGQAMSAYSCSKFAQGALLDALRRELRPSGIRVIQICPGLHNTPILTNRVKDKTGPERYNAASENVKRRYGDILAEEVSIINRALKMAQHPKHVVSAVKGAMLNRWPKARILVGVDAQVLWGLNFLPACLSDPILRQ